VISNFNKYSRRVLFIETGPLRTFYLQDGKGITHFFFDENDFIAPVNSILEREPERYRWEALELAGLTTKQSFRNASALQL